jgi:hypothetical protein
MQGTLFGLWWAFAIAVCRFGDGGLVVEMLRGRIGEKQVAGNRETGERYIEGVCC